MEWEQEDEERTEPDDRRTLRELRKMANSIEDDIKMKEDVGSNYQDGMLPMLDVKMWVGNREGRNGGKEIKYRFYEKPMASKVVLMERSALPIKTKIQILVQEIVRRRRNTYQGESRMEIERELTEFMVKLKISGYSREHRWEILKSGTKKYHRMLKNEKEGKRSLNRPKWEGGHGRCFDKIMKKTNWYRKRNTRGKEEKHKNRETGGKNRD